ncbi:MAG: FtsL-like putative cell division protein [Cytophagales bacterium]
MANTFRKTDQVEIPENSADDKKGLFSTINKTFRIEGMFDEGVPTKYLPQVLWVTVLIILYIANAHYTEKTIRKIDKLKFEVEDLRTEYTTLKAGYMFDSKQSEVARKMAVYGLVESKSPPLKLDITE